MCDCLFNSRKEAAQENFKVDEPVERINGS